MGKGSAVGSIGGIITGPSVCSNSDIDVVSMRLLLPWNALANDSVILTDSSNALTKLLPVGGDDV